MLLPRALAIRKTTLASNDTSAASGQAARQVHAVQPISPNPHSPCQRPQVYDQAGTPINSNKVSKSQRPTVAGTQFVCDEDPKILPEGQFRRFTGKLWSSQLGYGVGQPVKHDPPRHFESNMTHRSATNYPVGCVVWLRGLPEANLTKPHVLQLIDAILEPSSTTEVISTQEMVPDSNVSNRSQKVKYVDFVKGLTNCHLRFCSPLWASQLVRIIQGFSGSAEAVSMVFVIDGISINCSRLEANLIDGRREEIYWQKIPKHLHNS